MILAIDAGNSRMKWGVFEDSGVLHAHGIMPNASIANADLPNAWTQCSRSIVSNVAGPGVAETLGNMLTKLNIPVHWLKAEAQACGVVNSYQSPGRLGTDRWASLIAAWHRYHAPCVVVNAGTALTIDALAEREDGQGLFLGGLIVPGLRLMQQSLVNATADIDCM
ncbi:MAG TPA: type III pantothenate kinase, partial [Methylophilaceae bacterium]|nr:type III pantothenate kinase [Methylophilaceae bacterium]